MHLSLAYGWHRCHWRLTDSVSLSSGWHICLACGCHVYWLKTVSETRCSAQALLTCADCFVTCVVWQFWNVFETIVFFDPLFKILDFLNRFSKNVCFLKRFWKIWVFWNVFEEFGLFKALLKMLCVLKRFQKFGILKRFWKLFFIFQALLKWFCKIVFSGICRFQCGEDGRLTIKKIVDRFSRKLSKYIMRMYWMYINTWEWKLRGVVNKI